MKDPWFNASSKCCSKNEGDKSKEARSCQEKRKPRRREKKLKKKVSNVQVNVLATKTVSSSWPEINVLFALMLFIQFLAKSVAELMM